MDRRIAAIDLFCGAGGLTHGLAREGIEVVAGVDIDPDARHPYEKNNSAIFLQEDIETIEGRDLRPYYPAGSVRLLAGCAPCQPFSTFSRKKDARASPEWGLLDQFARLVGEIKPAIVSMENVVNLRRYPVFGRFVRSLERWGYEISDFDVECARYGVPQNRTRLVLFASKLGKVGLISPTHYLSRRRTVRNAIGKLPTLEAGVTSREDPVHRAADLADLNRRRIQASVPGGSWKDWSDDLVLECHRTDEGRSYVPVYGRMSWDAPAPTITTKCFNYGSGRFGHPEQDRAISLREAALLQSFPRGYEFVPKGEDVRLKNVGRLIGNAVPVRLGRAIGRSIVRHVEGRVAG